MGCGDGDRELGEGIVWIAGDTGSPLAERWGYVGRI